MRGASILISSGLEYGGQWIEKSVKGGKIGGRFAVNGRWLKGNGNGYRNPR